MFHLSGHILGIYLHVQSQKLLLGVIINQKKYCSDYTKRNLIAKNCSCSYPSMFSCLKYNILIFDIKYFNSFLFLFFFLIL